MLNSSFSRLVTISSLLITEECDLSWRRAPLCKGLCASSSIWHTLGLNDLSFLFANKYHAQLN